MKVTIASFVKGDVPDHRQFRTGKFTFDLQELSALCSVLPEDKTINFTSLSFMILIPSDVII